MTLPFTATTKLLLVYSSQLSRSCPSARDATTNYLFLSFLSLSFSLFPLCATQRLILLGYLSPISCFSARLKLILEFFSLLPSPRDAATTHYLSTVSPHPLFPVISILPRLEPVLFLISLLYHNNILCAVDLPPVLRYWLLSVLPRTLQSPALRGRRPTAPAYSPWSFHSSPTFTFSHYHTLSLCSLLYLLLLAHSANRSIITQPELCLKPEHEQVRGRPPVFTCGRSGPDKYRRAADRSPRQRQNDHNLRIRCSTGLLSATGHLGRWRSVSAIIATPSPPNFDW